MNHPDFAADFPRTQAVIAQGIERGLHTGCQIYVSRRGEVRADVGVGESRPGVAMTADTINLWLSSGKPLTAVAVLQQCERGAFSLDDEVARFIPEFAAGGKSEITIRHLLTHTGGFRNVETGYPEASWDEVIRRICASPLEKNWIVGHSAGYHMTTSWFILGELLQRVTGRLYADVMRDELLRPLGLNDTWAALPFDQYAAYGEQIGWLSAREQGELKLLDWSSAARCAASSPGSNTRGPIRELGRFYEMLLNEGEEVAGAHLATMRNGAETQPMGATSARTARNAGGTAMPLGTNRTPCRAKTMPALASR